MENRFVLSNELVEFMRNNNDEALVLCYNYKSKEYFFKHMSTREAYNALEKYSNGMSDVEIYRIFTKQNIE